MLSQKEIEILNLIEEDDSYKNYFFKKAKDLKWFFPLKERKHFSPHNAPGPKPAEGESYSIPYWNVLGYLERASQQLNDPNNRQYIAEFLNIIESVTNFTDENGHIDNFYTWWSFVKILLNIPNDKIPLKVIELIPIWLKSKFGARLQGTDIALKLLPKFLNDDSSQEDILKAERIINYITEVKLVPLSEARLKSYKRTNEYKLVMDDYWLRKSAEKYSEIIGEKCSEKVVDQLSSKIKMLLKKDSGRASFDKVDNKSYAIILMQDNGNYTIKIIQINGESYNYFLGDEKEGVIIETKTLSISREDELIKKALKFFEELEPFKEVKEEQLKQRLHYAYRNLYDEGTYTSLYTKYEHPRTEPLEVLIDFLKGILVSKAKHNVEGTAKVINHFFEEDYFLFHKMALFIIAQDTENYANLFWKQLTLNNYTLIRESLYFGDELRHLLKNIKYFSTEQKKILKAIIESGPEYIEFEVDEEKRSASWKQQRYEALVHDPEFKKLYENYKSVTGWDVQLRPAIGKVVTRWGPGKSHLTKEQILQMSNEELSIFLSQAKNEDFWEGAQIRALADTLKEAVKDQPEKFTNDLSPFLRNGYMYIYEILWGLRDAWRNNQSIDWNSLFCFIRQYVFKDEFWQDKYKIETDGHFTPNYKSVVSEIAELIEDGTKKDDWAFDESLLEDTEDILLTIFDNLKEEGKVTDDEEEEQFRDPITHALNSTFGKVLNAFINFALRKARVEKKKGNIEEVKWSQTLRGKYEKALNDNIPEAYTLFGQFMPNFCFLDKAWTEEKIKCLEEIDNDKLWSSFMYGYFFINNFYDDLYHLMKNNYKKALKTTFKGDRANERLVQHISIAYLRGLEDLSEQSFFGILIKDWKVSQIEDVIDFFYSMRGRQGKDSLKEMHQDRQKVIQFWKLAYEKYINQQTFNEDDKKILSELSKLIVFLDKIDSENFEWLKLSAKFINVDYNSPNFIEHLDVLKNKGNSAHYIGDIYFEMLNNFTPDYDKKHIVSTVEYLSSLNGKERDDAKKICEIYGKRGDDDLRPIFDKFFS